jgi:hypothetical protein
VSQAAHQLSFFGKYEIFSVGTQTLFQILADSSSLGASSSHSKIVTAIFLGSKASQSLLVKSSQDQEIDSFLK